MTGKEPQPVEVLVESEGNTEWVEKKVAIDTTHDKWPVTEMVTVIVTSILLVLPWYICVCVCVCVWYIHGRGKKIKIFGIYAISLFSFLSYSFILKDKNALTYYHNN
jgi:hypothetical protein